MGDTLADGDAAADAAAEDAAGDAVAVTKGVAVGVGRSVTSTVVIGVGWGAVGLHAASNIIASIMTATRAKITFLFIELFASF